MLTIAILGGTSHIAKGLIYNFLKERKVKLYLFVRSRDSMESFLREEGLEGDFFIADFSELNNYKYDAIINCIGISGTVDFDQKLCTVFDLTEKFDSLILEYLKKNAGTQYINFSSGAVFGTVFEHPVDCTTLAKWNVNNLSDGDYYGIAKLNSEAKHRSHKDLNIIDLRIYGYFSRFINLYAKYFLTEIINCVKEGKEFLTDKEDIVRDYIHPGDLFLLVERCLENKVLNDVFDAYSLKPVKKFEIINYFSSQYGLKYSVREDINFSSITGIKYNYYSLNRKAQKIGYYPKLTSLEGIALEAEKLLGNKL